MNLQQFIDTSVGASSPLESHQSAAPRSREEVNDLQNFPDPQDGFTEDDLEEFDQLQQEYELRCESHYFADTSNMRITLRDNGMIEPDLRFINWTEADFVDMSILSCGTRIPVCMSPNLWEEFKTLGQFYTSGQFCEFVFHNRFLAEAYSSGSKVFSDMGHPLWLAAHAFNSLEGLPVSEFGNTWRNTHFLSVREQYGRCSGNVKRMFACSFYDTPIMDALRPCFVNISNHKRVTLYGNGSLLSILSSPLFYHIALFLTCFLIVLSICFAAFIAYSPLSFVTCAYFTRLITKETPPRRIRLTGAGKNDKTPQVRKQDKRLYNDGDTNQMKVARLKQKVSVRTKSAMLGEGVGLSCTWSDPVFRFWNPTTKAEFAPDIAYTLFDGDIRVVPKGFGTCLLDAMFATYLSTVNVKTEEDFENYLDRFNNALYRSTSQLYLNRTESYLSYLAGDELLSTDLLPQLCDELHIKVIMLGRNPTPGMQERLYCESFGTRNVVMGRDFNVGYAGVLCNITSTGCQHFALADSLSVRFDCDVNAVVNHEGLRIKDLVASYPGPTGTRQIKSRVFSMLRVSDDIPCVGKVADPVGVISGKIEKNIPKIAEAVSKARESIAISRMEEDKSRFELDFSYTNKKKVTYHRKLVFKAVPSVQMIKDATKSYIQSTEYNWPKYEGASSYSIIAFSSFKVRCSTPCGYVKEFESAVPWTFERIKDHLLLELDEAECMFPAYDGTGSYKFAMTSKKKKEESSDSSDDSSSSSDSERKDEGKPPEVRVDILYDGKVIRRLSLTAPVRDLDHAKMIIKGFYEDEYIVHSWDAEWIRVIDNTSKDEDGDSGGPSSEEDTTTDSTVEHRTYDDMYGVFTWGEKMARAVITSADDVNPVFTTLLNVLHGSTARAIWSSKIARLYCSKFCSSSVLEMIIPKLKLLKVSLKSHESFNLFLSIMQANKRLSGEIEMLYNPRFMERAPGDAYARRVISNKFTYKFAKVVEANDVYDYARSVNQLHDKLALFYGRKVEYVPFDFESEEDVGLCLARLNDVVINFPKLTVMRVPESDTKFTKCYQQVKEMKVCRFVELEDWEKILFLGCFSEGYKVIRSDFLFCMEMVAQLTSMQVLAGCKDELSVNQRIDTKASSALAKFHMSKFALFSGVDVCMNSVVAAKCIAASRVEMLNSKQKVCGLDSESCKKLDTVGKTKESTETITLFGAGVRHRELNIFGYHTDECKDMKPPGKVVPNFKFLAKRNLERPRKVMGVTNYNVKGNLAPVPDTDYGPNIQEGLIKRIGAAVPEPEENFKICFPWFVQHLIDYHELRGALVELLIEEVDEMKDWEKYKKTLRYNPARLRQLDLVRKEVAELETFCFSDNEEGRLLKYLWTKVEAHVKWESYQNEKKYVRMIFARMDHFKVFFGPYSKLMQKVMYKKLRCYITNIPVRDLPKYLLSYLCNFDLIFTTDFSMFESHNYPWLMYHCFVQITYALFSHEMDEELATSLYVLVDTNIIENQHVSCKIDGKVMSGETTTTLTNTDTNYFLLCYILECEGLVYGSGFFFKYGRLFYFAFRGSVDPDIGFELVIFCAGDDGLFGLTLIPGVDYTVYESEDYLNVYGVKLKISIKESISGSGFLSKYYSEIDLKTLCDPLKQLSKCILSPKYSNSSSGVKKALARARAMSLLYEFGHCPIVGSYAKCVLRCTRNVQIKKALVLMQKDDWYKFEAVEEAVSWYESESKKFGHDMDLEIGMSSRMVIEESFDIPICTQFYIEEYFDSVDTTVHPVEFDVPCLDLITSEANSQFYAEYCFERQGKTDTCPNYVPERPLYKPEYVLSEWYDRITMETVHVACAA